VEEYILNASVSRVLSAKAHWQEILECAHNPEMEIIISNTTEVGIVLVENDKITGGVPVSFPGKLLAFLYERYQFFNGDPAKGMVIVPTELVTNNGDKLHSIVAELAHLNDLDYKFIDWIESANIFCNSLVDRIVPGKLPEADLKATEALLGYRDDLMIMSEVYSLWAIEAHDKKVKEKLSFAQTDETVVITENIDKFRELKLRLLNGTHTFSCGLAFLAGFDTVKEGMQNPQMAAYVQSLMKDEMAPCVTGDLVSTEEAQEFAANVIGRFKNPFIDHHWLSITLNYTHKMKTRNVPMLLKHYGQDLYVPSLMALGFASYILFMNCEPGESGNYYGKINGNAYLVQDEHARYFCETWRKNEFADMAKAVLSNTELWEEDLSELPGFCFAVQKDMESIIKNGALNTISEIHEKHRKVV
jgi:tagaturonate reductase